MKRLENETIIKEGTQRFGDQILAVRFAANLW